MNQLRPVPSVGMSRITEDTFHSYLDNMCSGKQVAREWTAACSAAFVSSGGSRKNKYLRHAGLMRPLRGMTDDKLNNISRWIGIHILDKKGDPPAHLPRIREALTFPWQDMPGRIKMVQMLNSRLDVSEWWVPYLPIMDTRTDPGLYMLDAAYPQREVVYSLSSPWIALALQVAYMRDHNQSPGPITAWHRDTSAATWGQFSKSRIVLWDLRLGENVFRQAIRAGDADIVTVPSPRSEVEGADYADWSKDVVRSFTRQGPDETLHLMARNAKPWPSVMAEWIRNDKRDAVIPILERLQLSNAQIERVVAEATSKSHEASLKEIFNSLRSRQECVIRGRTYTQRIGSSECEIFAEMKGSHPRERISDAVVTLNETIFMPDDGDVVIRGTVLHQGKSYPLETTLDKMDSSKSIKEITLAVASGGGPVPNINSSCRGYLLDIIRAFSPRPTARHALTRVGWDDRGVFNLPNLKIEDGVIQPQDRVVVGVDGKSCDSPCSLMSNPDRHISTCLEGWMDPMEINEVGWAILAAVLSNITSSQENRITTGIGLVGPGAHHAGKEIANALGLVHVIPSKLENMLESEKAHDLPVWASVDEMRNSVVTCWLASTAPKNCLVTLSDEQAASCGRNEDWVLIECQEDLSCHPVSGDPFGILLHYVADYQSGESLLSGNRGGVTAILSGLREWAMLNAEQVNPVVFSRAKQRIRDLASNPGDRFMALLFLLKMNGAYEIEYRSSDAPHKSTLVFDQSMQRVTINVTRIIQILRRRGLPDPDTDAIQDHLNLLGIEQIRGNLIWYLDINDWEERSRVWMQKHNIEFIPPRPRPTTALTDR